MASLRCKSLIVLAVVATVLSATQPVSAQQRRGRRGGGRGVTRVQLTSLKNVQAELKLTDEQKKLTAEISEKLNADRTEMMREARDGGGGFAEIREKFTKMNAEATSKLVAKLDDAQKKRLTEVFVQVNGLNSLRDKEVSATLKITEEQTKKLTEVQTKNREAMREASRNFRDMSDEERQTATKKMTKESNERFTAVLTDEQKEMFRKLKGEKIEIDMTQLRGRRGGRGQRGRGGQRDGGRAQRPE